MPPRPLAGLRVAVTGASQGIGRALCVEAARRGMRVLAQARGADALDELAAEVRGAGSAVGVVVPVPGDVTVAADRQRLADAATTHFGGLDVLVNNAGIGATGHLSESSVDTLRAIMEVNYFGAVETTRTLLPLLRGGVTPAVVMISSIVGKRAWPARGFYSASKFALQAFSDELRIELRPAGVSVVVVSPGLTRTNFSKNMLERSARIPMDHLRGMTSEAVAVATLDALRDDRPDTVLTPRGRLLVAVARHAPWVIDFVGKRKIRALFAGEIAARAGRHSALHPPGGGG